MSPRVVAGVLLVWGVALATACLVVHATFALEIDEAHPRAVVASVWRGGQRIARVVLPRADDRDATIEAAAAEPGSTRVLESVVAEGPVPTWPELALALSFVPGRDGLVARLGERVAYVTPDDLLAMQAYDHGAALPSIQLTMGLDLPLVLAKAADDLGVPVRDLLDHGTLRRVRVVRALPASSERVVTAETLTDEDVRRGVVAMARYLARGVDDEGRFRYLVDAPTNRTLPGYDWPRHAGATYFLVQAAALTGDGDLGYAALRAAGLLRDGATVACGEHRCIGDDVRIVDVGSTALAVLAFVEVARTGLDPGYALAVPELTAFLRAQQRGDGELMHLYDRQARRPIDLQLLYFSGEAAFALSRASALTRDPRDLEAATRVVAYLVGPGWSFFGSRYYRGEEHWTCQAMDDLWGRAPKQTEDDALDFCLTWQAYGRALMYGPGDTPYDADGAYGVGPVLVPHLTPAASRSEAGLATLDAATRAGRPVAETAPLDRQMRRSLALLLRHQLDGTGSSPFAHLFADPAAVDGAVPGSEVDWQLRIDYVQHTGSALIRWLSAHEGAPIAHPQNE